MTFELVEKMFGPTIGAILDGFNKELSHIARNRILEYEVNEFKRNKYSKTIMHRSSPIDLDSFYLPLNLVVKDGVDGRPTKIDTKSVKSLFEKFNYITIIGDAGSGKSTLIKYLFTNSIEVKYKIPIKVELRYLNHVETDIIEYIKKDVLEFHGISKSDHLIDRLLDSGKFVIFLDGYDEITPEKKELCLHQIDRLVSRYPNNKYLVSSRPNTGIESFPSFHNSEISDLSTNEIISFIKLQNKEEPELSMKIINAVNTPVAEQYKSFLSNPLLLSMFIMTFRSNSEIPKRKSEFFQQVFDTLYRTHDSESKLGYVRVKESGLEKNEFESVLGLFSFLSYFDDSYVFTKSYLYNCFDKIKKSYGEISFDNYKLLSDLTVAINILTKDGNVYQFPHRSMQEYFCAICISQINDEVKDKLYSKFLDDVLNQNSNLLSSANMYSILLELDKNKVIKDVIIPIWESLLVDLNDFDLDNENDILNLWTLTGVFNYVMKSFYERNAEFESYRKRIKNASGIEHTQFMIMKDEYTVTGKQNLESLSNFVNKDVAEKHLKPIFIELKIALPEEIERLKTLVKNKDLGDETIFSLIGKN